MKTALARSIRGLAVAALLSPLAHAQVSLYTAVDLAMRNSAPIRSAAAGVARAVAGISEAKDVFIPNLVAGSGIGPPPYGFPLGEPSLFDVTTNSLVFSFAQSDYIRAARMALKSAQMNLRDVQEQVALDVSLDYTQLDSDAQTLAALEQQKGYADALIGVEQNRVLAGVDPRMEELQAELLAAQIDLKRVHLTNEMDNLRQKLGHLTGLPSANFQTETGSIPPLPNFSAGAGGERGRSNPGVASAYANAKSKYFLSFGDEKQNYRPQFGFGAQYSRFAGFQNYSEYYQHFQVNNFVAGVQITLPLFDASRRAKARESAAEALQAQTQADSARITASEQISSMQRSISELVAQQKVAELQSQIAQAQLQTVEDEARNGSGSPSAAPVTPRQTDQAHIDERQRYQEMLDANYSVTRLELNLMRVSGTILDWVRTTQK